VRSQQTAPAAEPDPDLFRPEKPGAVPLPGAEEAVPTLSTQPAPSPSGPPKPEAEIPASTTSRLLEAKRRAQKRKQ
jgi:hypothetical protein